MNRYKNVKTYTRILFSYNIKQNNEIFRHKEATGNNHSEGGNTYKVIMFSLICGYCFPNTTE